MNKFAAKAVERTGKPYGGIIENCQFITLPSRESFEGRTEFTIAHGNLIKDPNNRFGFMGNFGMRTSYIIKKTKTYIETRNTIYEYTV